MAGSRIDRLLLHGAVRPAAQVINIVVPLFAGIGFERRGLGFLYGHGFLLGWSGVNPVARPLFPRGSKKPRRLSPSGPFIGLRYFSIAFRQ
jgi:hypothetical protein